MALFRPGVPESPKFVWTRWNGSPRFAVIPRERPVLNAAVTPNSETIMADPDETNDEGSASLPAPEELRQVLALAARRSATDGPTPANLEPHLANVAERQRRIAMALQSGGPAVPPTLEKELDQLHRRRRRQPRSGALKLPALSPLKFGAALAGACAAGVAVVALLVSGGSGGVTASRVSAAWKLPATTSAVAPRPGNRSVLDVSFHGTAFPNYHDSEGWHPVGTRSGEIAGRSEFTVYYATGARRASYTVVAGSRVAVPSSARRLVAGGTPMAEFRDGDRWVIVFQNRGNTCVLAAAAPREKHWLVKLAAWDAGRSTSSE